MIKKIKDFIAIPFSKHLRNSQWGFICDDAWTVYEAIMFAMIINKANIKKTGEQLKCDFLLYEKIIVDGVKSGEIELIKGAFKKESKWSRDFLDVMAQLFGTSYNSEPEIGTSTPETFFDSNKIDMIFMKRCINRNDVVEYYKREKIVSSASVIDDHPLLHSNNSGLIEIATTESLVDQLQQIQLTEPSSPNYSCVQIEHASLRDHTVGGIELPIIDKNEVIKQSRSEAGKKNGEKWRNFVSNVIKPAVEQELNQNCLCLHRDMANRLRENMINEAKTNYEPKKFNTIKADLPDKIEDGIKKVFYEFDNKYDNVRSRVFRGKYYDSEYDHVPCSLHSGK